MLKISSSSLLNIATKLLIILVVTKASSLALFVYLPSDGVELVQKQNYQPMYQRVDFKNMIKSTQKVKTKVVKSEITSSISITNMILKGLYGTSNSGFAIVSLKASPKKTSIVGVGEIFSGYRLESIHSNSVIFSKSNKDYVLELEKLKENKSYIKRVHRKNSSNVRVDNDEPKAVSRDDIASYAKNPKQIWKDISIIPLKKGRKIDGFKVTKIRRGSKMAQLGLQKGDVIIRANNIELKSYKDALNLYSKIDTIDTMQIVVIRNNQEKELVYEIN